MRYNHPLQTEVDSLRRELAGEQRQLQVVTAERDAAEDRFVKARAENDELEQELADLRHELYAIQTRNLEKQNAKGVGAISWALGAMIIGWAVLICWAGFKLLQFAIAP